MYNPINNNQMKTNSQKFEVSGKTAGYLQALRTLETFRDQYLTALENQFGMEQGETIYNDGREALDGLTAALQSRIVDSIMDNFSRTGNESLI